MSMDLWTGSFPLSPWKVSPNLQIFTVEWTLCTDSDVASKDIFPGIQKSAKLNFRAREYTSFKDGTRTKVLKGEKCRKEG